MPSDARALRSQAGQVHAAHFYHAIGCTRIRAPSWVGARGPFLPCHRMHAHYPTCAGPCFERPCFEKGGSIPSVRNLTLSAVIDLAPGELAKCSSNEGHGHGLKGAKAQQDCFPPKGLQRAPGGTGLQGPHWGPWGLLQVPMVAPMEPPPPRSRRHRPPPLLPETIFWIIAIRNKCVKMRQLQWKTNAAKCVNCNAK